MAEAALSDVLAAVRERIEPSAEERERLTAAVETVIGRAEDAVVDLPVEADVLHLGSTSRDTWLAGTRDIDVFVRFPPDLSRDQLEEYGLDVGHTVLPDGREEYAEHPYVHGEVAGFGVDLVPCYAVESPEHIASAVDRTPFHAAYLENHLTDDLAAAARLGKQFLTGAGAYGSDLRTRGFSGYLTELLVIGHGGFRPWIEAATDWQPPVQYDPEGHGTADRFDDPLVMVDPTDPGRNVAAVCSPENVARVQHYARALLADPRTDHFFPDEPDPLSPAAVRAHLDRRGTTPVAVVFSAPDLVEDELYPQLQRSLGGIGDALDRQGFDVLRREVFANGRAALLFELDVAERSAVERHEGPPVAARPHAERFVETYTDADVYGPFVEDDRYVVERERAVTDAVAFLESDAIFEMALGASVRRALEDGYEVLADDAVADLADTFEIELARYFDPQP